MRAIVLELERPVVPRWLLVFAFAALSALLPWRAGAQETPTETETTTPSATPTIVVTAEPSPTDTAAADTATPTETETATETFTPTETDTPTETPTPSPTATATETFTPTPIPTESLPRGCRSVIGSDPIECGEILICALQASGETKNYTFGAVAGDAVCISTAASPDSRLQPRWTLVGPSFQPVPGCASRGGGLGCCDDLPATGDYNVIVQDSGDDQTGNYAISVHGVGSLNRDDAFNCATRLPCGTVHTASLRHPADTDAYRFSALAGQALNINTAPLEGAPIEPRWQLFQPNGREVAGCGTNFGGQQNCSDLPASGSYTLIVSDAGSDESGDYALSVQTTSQTNCCAGSIGEGETIEGAFTERGQTDAYAFAADFGGGVNISTAPVPGSPVDPAWRLFGPNGRAVGGCFTTAGGTKSCADLPLRGTYVIVVGDAGGDEVGAYSIALQGDAVAGECAAVPICPGDCDDDGRVGVSELIGAIDAALGVSAVDLCRAADTGGDGAIAIDELVAAVRNSVQGCP